MALIPKECDQQFLASRRSPSVPFVINDAVQVVTGPYSGRRGSVVSVAAVEPELVLVVELGDGLDVELVAKHMRLIDDAGEQAAGAGERRSGARSSASKTLEGP
ncbi:MAG: hypothetical protein ACK58T_42810 [Phycisphaerae bacterium]|jgi:hypothetical protein